MMCAQAAHDAWGAQNAWYNRVMPTTHLDVGRELEGPLHVCIPNPDVQPTITVSDASRIAGVALRTGYAAAQRGEWPAVRTGRAVRIRTRQFLELCGFTGDAA